jgi:hypothetical protein
VFAHLRELPRVGQEAPPNELDEEEEYVPFDEEAMLAKFPSDCRLRKHFGFGQNDARIIGGECTDSFFRLTFNHYDVERLAACAGLLTGDALDGAFPVSIEFVDVQELFVMRSAEDRFWQLIRNTRSDVFDNLLDVNEFRLHGLTEDEIIATLIVNEWSPFRRRRTKYYGWSSEGVNIHVRAKAARVIERYREGWIEHCGKDSLPLLDAFEDVWPQRFWGVSDFEKWIKEQGFEIRA